MGICWPRCAKKQSNRRIVLILIGLDNAGKTQTVNTLSGVEGSVMPTVGFKAVNLVHRDTPVTIYDLGGGSQIRDIWPQYYSEVHGVVFVIDSSDSERMEECRQVLSQVISHERIAGKPILILANKQDKRGALDDIDIVEKLGIERLVNRYRCPTLVETYTAAATEQGRKRRLDPGLKKGYSWLLNYIVRRYGDINLRVQTDIHAELERRRRLSRQNTKALMETGFENPHYVTLSRNSTPITEADKIKSLQDGVIVVKPIPYNDESRSDLDNTKSPDYSTSDFDNKIDKLGSSTDYDDLKTPKNLSDNSKITKTYQESDRSILSDDSRGANVDFDRTVVRSTPFDRTKVIEDTEVAHYENAVVIEEIIEEKFDSSVPNISEYKPSAKPRSKVASAVERKYGRVDIRSRPQSSPSMKAVRIEAEMETRTEDSEILEERLNTADKTRSCEKLRVSSGVKTQQTRPASASQLIRRQLEVAPLSRRRVFSLRYPLRNKTCPMALFHFEPGKEGEGDFELQPRDVTL